MTNFEKIKAMSIKEMVEFIMDIIGEDGCYCCPANEFWVKYCKDSFDCYEPIGKWLESEVD